MNDPRRYSRLDNLAFEATTPDPSPKMYVRSTRLPPVPVVRSAASQMMNNKSCTIKFGLQMTNISWFDYLKMYHQR